MIVGIGVDLVDLARFERAVDRTPRLRERLFAESERSRPLRSLAGRFAAKEALIKALGSSDGVHWLDIVVSNSDEGDPGFEISGETAKVIEARGIDRLHLSMSHDAGAAIAFVIAERSEPDRSQSSTEVEASQKEEKS
ncbi:holo-ACP synthase [Mycetocola zhujimingii]|uniref:Holo-[acyl-carrier-protein] synthase n=1 Tax=Mycetocola zhujimingii TaxID=2079792 RepID=A0A2U1TDZ9_9MICO|nr:holo-ACP synthase [Mycetocola zhujimingii]PWC07040.1 holo-ACP synthase [Mycetocola zhujimingii]